MTEALKTFGTSCCSVGDFFIKPFQGFNYTSKKTGIVFVKREICVKNYVYF